MVDLINISMLPFEMVNMIMSNLTVPEIYRLSYLLGYHDCSIDVNRVVYDCDSCSAKTRLHTLNSVFALGLSYENNISIYICEHCQLLRVLQKLSDMNIKLIIHELEQLKYHHSNNNHTDVD